MQQICKFQSNFEKISRDCCTIVVRLSYDNRETFVRVSHNIPTNTALVSFSFVQQLQDIRKGVSRHSYECQLSIQEYVCDPIPLNH